MNPLICTAVIGYIYNCSGISAEYGKIQKFKPSLSSKSNHKSYECTLRPTYIVNITLTCNV